MIDTTLMGPGWLMFFQHGGLVAGGGGEQAGDNYKNIDQAQIDFARREYEIREQERIDAIILDDQEIIELVCMLVASGVFDEFC